MKKSEMVDKACLYWLGLFPYEEEENKSCLQELRPKMEYLIEYLCHNGMLPPKVNVTVYYEAFGIPDAGKYEDFRSQWEKE